MEMIEQTDDSVLVAHGRRFVLIATVVLMASSVIVSAVYVWRIGFDRVREQSTSLVLTWALGYFMLQGRAWARWVTVALLLVALLGALPFLVRTGAWSRDGLAETIPILALYTAYVFIARGLLYSRSVRAFFAAHRPHTMQPPGGLGR